MSTDEYEASAHATAANRFGATVYVGFEPRTEPGTTIAYFAVPHFESFGGRALATCLATALDGVVSSDPTIIGMRLPVLRETRMPAVVVTPGPGAGDRGRRRGSEPGHRTVVACLVAPHG